MNIIFDRLHIESFMSIGEADIDLHREGYTLIEGINNCVEDSASSNGSGKSSIWEALVWCLTGETIRGTTNIENMFCDSGTVVRCEFRVNEHTYMIERMQNRSGLKSSLRFFVDGTDASGKGVRDTKESIKQYLPDFDSLLLGSVIILGQGLPARFTANTPSGRKEILERLTKSDFMIDDLKDRITERSSKLKDYADDISSKVIAFKSSIHSNEELVGKLSNQIRIEDIDKYNKKIEYDSKEINRLSKEKITNETQRDSLEDRLEAIEQKLDYQDSNHRKNLEEINRRYDDLISNSRKEYYSLQSIIESLKNKINELESVQEYCPTCGQRLPDVHKIDTTSLHDEYTSTLSKMDDKGAQLEDIKKKKNTEIDTVSAQYNDDIKSLKKERENLRSIISDYSKQISKLETSISELKSEIKSLERNIDFIRENNDSIKQQIDVAKESIESTKIKLEDIQKKSEEISQRQEIVSKFQTAVTRDFRGYLLSNIISFINDRCSVLSKVLFDNGNISVSLDRNNVSVKLNDKEYEMLSGGERQKVDVVVQFAIRDMLCSYTGFSSSIIVLDEIFDSIDLCGCDKIINLIGSELQDINSIYIISHHADELQVPVDNIIKVIKSKDKISRIEQ